MQALKRFSGDEPTLSDLEWESVVQAVSGYLKLGNSGSFELPFFNQIWSRDLTRRKMFWQKDSCHMVVKSFCVKQV